MSVTDVHKDPATASMTITASFDAPVEKVWRLWADPRLLERWWGPPTWPATFVDHDFSPGGHVGYYMTGPEGEKSAGWWTVQEVQPPHRLVFEDGFADDSGRPKPDLPTTHVTVTLEETADGTVMKMHSVFPSAEDMEKLIAMGMEEGIVSAMSQMDAVLAEA
jgi:uncharacterized protein YndB with AHSA1/START domain